MSHVAAIRGLVQLLMLVPLLSFADDSLSVAVASNFHGTVTEIATGFTRATQIPVNLSSGSTGKLYAQIVNGAPYDIFLAADVARPKLLEAGGLAVSGSRVTYAVGALVLWSADVALSGEDCHEALMSGNYRRLAMANPKTAPYGLAARTFLQSVDAMEATSDRVVLGENISQTLHFVATGNATLGFVALSQLRSGLPVETACQWPVPASSHAALDQQGVILSRSAKPAAAHEFMAFLRGVEAAAILERSGYTVP